MSISGSDPQLQVSITMSIQWPSCDARVALSLALAVGAVGTNASAGILSTANQSVWNYYVSAGGLVVETENFNSIADGSYSSPFGGSTASVTWSASAAGGLYVDDGVFSTNQPEMLVFAFAPGVRAVAGNFFGTDINFNNVSVLFTVTLSDGSGYSSIADNPSSFTGFYSTTSATIAALTLTVANIAGSAAVYPSVDNLYFGVAPAPIPSPGSVALLAVAGLLSSRRR